MIINEYVEIKVNSAQLKNLSNKGLKVSIGDEIKIPITYLSDGSNIAVDCKCDVCGNIKKHTYRRYLRSIKNGGYYACSSKCAQSKTKNTFIERYGEEHHFKSKATKDKIKKTFKKNYGTEHFSHSKTYKKNVDTIQNKRRKTINSLYKERENITIISSTGFTKYCEYHNGYYEIDKILYHNRKQHNINTCTTCFPMHENCSIKEKELLKFIENNYNEEIISNYKIENKEIDVFLPHLKLGFEFNGLHWHDELHRPNNYHQLKTEFFESKNIKLIHIYEDDWDNKNEIIKSRILNLLGTSQKIYARKCMIKELIPSISKKFLNENHIQGNINSNIKLGLFYGDELVSVMTFGGLRKSLGSKIREDYYEMLRFCNKKNIIVIGGASKLFHFFIKKYKPLNVVSYADRSWSNGNLYFKLGFKMTHKTEPNYYYIVNKIRFNRYNFRKDKLIKEGFDKSLTERQIMINRKIYRIYDSGSLVFTFTTNN